MEPETARKARALGDAIRAGRQALSLSQEDFAERCDLHRTYIGAMERGEYNPTLGNLIKVSRALNLTPSQLLARAGL